MNTYQKCNCCIHEPICGNKFAYQYGVKAILEAAFLAGERSVARVKDATHIEVSIKCPHYAPKNATMYDNVPCNTCEYRLDNGKIRTSCLACKWAYFESDAAFENKADLYVKEEQHGTNKAE